MEMQLGALQMQQWSHKKELAERQSDMAARRQLKAAQDWADNYLTDIGAGLATLELDPAALPDDQRAFLYEELQAWRFEDKFPDDRLKQLQWTQLEERRRVVRSLIKRINITPTDGYKRDIRPVLALDIPLEDVVLMSESLDSGYQALEHIESWRKETPEATIG